MAILQYFSSLAWAFSPPCVVFFIFQLYSHCGLICHFGLMMMTKITIYDDDDDGDILLSDLWALSSFRPRLRAVHISFQL